MNTITVELNFSPEQVSQLDEVARTHDLILAETIQLAVTEWLEKQYRLKQARTQMRELGQGLGAGKPPTIPKKITDCTSFATMHRLGLTEAFTGDHHFRVMGFVLTP